MNIDPAAMSETTCNSLLFLVFIAGFIFVFFVLPGLQIGKRK